MQRPAHLATGALLIQLASSAQRIRIELNHGVQLRVELENALLQVVDQAHRCESAGPGHVRAELTDTEVLGTWGYGF